MVPLLWFSSLHPIWQALLATGFTYGVTALGAATVFFFRSVSSRLLDMAMGFAAGIMIAASFWSLLSPAIALSAAMGRCAWLTAALGFLAGGAFVIGADPLLRRLARFQGDGRLRRSALLCLAVTLHNFPEGLAVGVAFGGAAAGVGGATLPAALTVALGIGLQNFPEGVCVAMPLRRDGASRRHSFLAGQASGLAEPAAGVLGALFCMLARAALPAALAFSAGAMIAVVCAELIPESFRDSKLLASCGMLLGFTLMMVLDVALG